MSSLKQLRKIVEAGREEREKYAKMYRWLESRRNEIRDAKEHVRISFWCHECERDFEGEGHKEVRLRKGDVYFAWYRGVCPQGHVAIRRITDRLSDPYFYLSTFVKREQMTHADDMLTPSDPRFKFVYPEAYSALIARASAG